MNKKNMLCFVLGIILIGIILITTSCSTTGKGLSDTDIEIMKANPHMPVGPFK